MEKPEDPTVDEEVPHPEQSDPAQDNTEQPDTAQNDNEQPDTAQNDTEQDDTEQDAAERMTLSQARLTEFNASEVSNRRLQPPTPPVVMMGALVDCHALGV